MKTRLALTLLALPLAATAQVSPSTALPPSGLASGSVQASRDRVAPTARNGYITQDGKTFVLRDGQILRLKEAITMTIKPDGMINNFDGDEVQIPAGMMLTADGRVAQAPQLPVLKDDPTGQTYSMEANDAPDASAVDSPASAMPAPGTGVGPGGSRENLDNDNVDSEVSATSGAGQNPLSGGTTSSDTASPGVISTTATTSGTGVGPGGSRENLNNDNVDSEVSATSGVGQNPLSGGTTSSDTATPGSNFSSSGSPSTLQSPQIDQRAIQEAR